MEYKGLFNMVIKEIQLKEDDVDELISLFKRFNDQKGEHYERRKKM